MKNYVHAALGERRSGVGIRARANGRVLRDDLRNPRKGCHGLLDRWGRTARSTEQLTDPAGNGWRHALERASRAASMLLEPQLVTGLSPLRFRCGA